MESVAPINPVITTNKNADGTITWYAVDDEGLLIKAMSFSKTALPAKDDYVTVPLPEYETGKFGFADGSRPQFDPDTNTWKPYKESVEPSPEMQAINQLGLLMASQLGDM